MIRLCPRLIHRGRTQPLRHCGHKLHTSACLRADDVDDHEDLAFDLPVLGPSRRRRLPGVPPSERRKALKPPPYLGPVCRRATVNVDVELVPAVIEFYRERLLPSYAKSGFLGASLLSDAEGRLVNLSYWSSQESLDANNESAAYQECMEELGQLLGEDTEPAIHVSQCHVFHAIGAGSHE
mmetsp:Transcript_73129/g.136697  ORF Transcript_73129/g.136697 Transcript_73129/m.136697 type:complete len:181 (+) Transcript_73129:40-582(+)